MKKPPRLTEKQLMSIVETMAEGVIVVSPDNSIVLWNRQMEALTGYKADEVIGESCDILDRLCGTEDGNCDLLGNSDVKGKECSLRSKSGEIIPVHRNCRILRDKNNKPLGAVATVSDLRRLKHVQEELEIARNTLELDLSAYTGHRLLVGTSKPMRQLKALIAKAAATDVTVLITGETGTGKELVALAVHKASRRRDKPFITINCSALSEGLLESELFGHVRGAFTGAVSNRIGRFEAASGGSIFLDEIGDISPLIQVKLLRVLQERVIERVGESDARPVDVRVIAATNKSLTDLVDRGNFRRDLYYRLKVFPLPTVPLRKRKADIKALVEHFVSRFSEQTGKKVTRLSRAAWHILLDYCWPGNVRELENAIEHAFVLVEGDCIEKDDLPFELRDAAARQAECTRDANGRRHTRTGGGTSPARGLAHIDKASMITLLKEAGGNQSEVARRLGVHRSTVLRHIRRLGIE